MEEERGGFYPHIEVNAIWEKAIAKYSKRRHKPKQFYKITTQAFCWDFLECD